LVYCSVCWRYVGGGVRKGRGGGGGGGVIPPPDGRQFLCHFSCSHSMMWQSVGCEQLRAAVFKVRSELPDTWSCGPQHYICPAGCLTRVSAAARPLRLWVGMSPGTWMLVCCEWCILSGRGLCDELITRPVECYRLWCLVVCDLETSWMRSPWPTNVMSPILRRKPVLETGEMLINII
jgi:hypothetical protein